MLHAMLSRCYKCYDMPAAVPLTCVYYVHGEWGACCCADLEVEPLVVCLGICRTHAAAAAAAARGAMGK
jgi:hypothetical protein